MKCPKCNSPINISKYKIIVCSCGSKLLAAMVNGRLELFDVTKED